jgi:tetratricopeptide (TPR) repeat protein
MHGRWVRASSCKACRTKPNVDNATKRQLKKPDQFIAMTEGGVHWAEEHRQKTITIAVIAVVAILVLVGGFTFYQHRQAAASTELGTAMLTYQTPLTNPQRPVPPGMKTFPDAKSRALAANTQFDQVADKYGMTKAGKIALYFAGLTYAESGENSQAEDSLKKVASSWDSELAASAKLALAELYQSTNRDSQAIDLYKDLAKGTAATVPPGLAQIQLAELYQSQGKIDDARKIYAQIKDKDKDAKGKPGAAAEIAERKLNPQPAGPALPPQ